MKSLDEQERLVRGCGWLLLLLLLIAGAWSFHALAADARVSWTNATQDTDGVPLPATGPDALAETRVAHGTCTATGGFDVTLGVSAVVVPATAMLFENLADGVYCFRARHATNAGTLSNWSAVVSKTITTPPKKPRPPAGVTAP